MHFTWQFNGRIKGVPRGLLLPSWTQENWLLLPWLPPLSSPCLGLQRGLWKPKLIPQVPFWFNIPCTGPITRKQGGGERGAKTSLVFVGPSLVLGCSSSLALLVFWASNVFLKTVYGTTDIQGVWTAVERGVFVFGHRWGTGWSMK